MQRPDEELVTLVSDAGSKPVERVAIPLVFAPWSGEPADAPPEAPRRLAAQRVTDTTTRW
jgi:hypothetical protein